MARFMSDAAVPCADGMCRTDPLCPTSGAFRSGLAALEEVAELVALLATNRGGYITGQNIRIDGGITRSV